MPSAQKDTRIRCPVCALSLDAIQRECCIKSCIPFVDKTVSGSAPCATASLPDLLELKVVTGQSSIVSRVGIPVRAIFGPLVAPHVPRPESSKARFSVGNYDSGYKDFVLSSDDSCNWMKFVRLAGSVNEQNLVAFQFRGSVYFAAIKEIRYGEELCVWYANNYAVDMDQVSVPGFKEGDVLEEMQVEMAPSTSNVYAPKEIVRSPKRKPSPRMMEDIDIGNFGLPQSSSIEFPSYWLSQTSRGDSAPESSAISQVSGEDEYMESGTEDETEGEDLGKLYRCGLCSEMFDRMNELTGHLDSLHPKENLASKGQSRCIYCNEAMRKTEFPEHFDQLHAVDNMYPCPECKKMFSSGQKVRTHHKLQHQIHRLACGLCEFSSQRYHDLNNHLQSSHKKKIRREQKMQCTICNKAFRTQITAESHMKKFHQMNEQEMDSMETALLKCVFCLISFRNQRNLTEHFQTHRYEETFFCKVCEKSYETYTQARKHNWGHKETLLNCEACGYETRNRDNLRRHKRSHEESVEKEITKRVRIRKTTTEHSVTVSSQEKLECKDCSKTFRMKRSLRRHSVVCRGKDGVPAKRSQKRLSKEELFFKCRIGECRVAFYKRDSLIRHIHETHPDAAIHDVPELNLPVKKFDSWKCVHCGSRFLDMEFARRHIEKKHKDLFDQASSAEDSDPNVDVFNKIMKLQRYNAYWCELCGCKFLTGKVLIKHLDVAHPDYKTILMGNQDPPSQGGNEASTSAMEIGADVISSEAHESQPVAVANQEEACSSSGTPTTSTFQSAFNYIQQQILNPNTASASADMNMINFNMF